MSWRLIISVLVSCSLAGCGTQPVEEPAPTPPQAAKEPPPPPPPPPPRYTGIKSLERGVSRYNAGDYDVAYRLLRQAVGDGLKNGEERARAYKYLAFIDCSRGNNGECRDSFRKAMKADPNFKLRKSELGHPLWGPVYEDVIAERKP